MAVTGSQTSVAWAAFLDDAPPALDLPVDRPRPTALGPGVAVVATPAIGDDARRAEAVAASVGADPSSVGLALWLLALARHGDEQDLVVGVRRPGLGAGTWLVVRARVDLARPFRHLVADAARALADAERRPVTVPALVAELGVEPGGGRHPVFQVALQVGERAGAVADAGQPPCDLVLGWRADAGGVALSLAYAVELFEVTTADRVLQRLAVLLRHALDDPDRPAGQLELLPAGERELLAQWNATAQPHDATATVAEAVAEQVARTPEATAVEAGERTLSYRQLDERADRLAHVLVERGIGPDRTVGIAMDRSLAMVISVLAVLKAGGAYVPIDPAYPPARRRYMLEQAAVRLVLVGHGGHDVEGGDVEVLEVDDDVTVAGDRPPGPPPTSATGEHLGYVIFTSGSTGQPKAVALPQRALTNLIRWQLHRPDFASGARTLQFASLSFDVSFQEIFTTWCSGGTLVLVADSTRRDPRALLAHVRSTGVERVFLPFVALRGLADAAAATGGAPASLREVYTAGEQLVVDDVVRSLFRQLPGALLENQYGPSESHVVTAHRLDPDPDTWPALPPIGGPIANSSVHVLDPDGRLRPIGVPGELFLGGACLAREYLGRPDLTAERFVERPEAVPGTRLYRTGDLARWSEDGTLQFLGRLDHQVKFRGFRIEPGEVASLLSAFPGVRQCVSSVVELDGVGPRLAAYLVPRDGERLELDQVHRYARDRLPDYLVPSHYVVLDALPMTSSGKVDVASLPAPSFDRRILGTAYEAPATPAERRLAEIWGELLGVADVGRHDDFFDLGGDSLVALELFLRITDAFATELPLGALAQQPTVAGLAGLLEGSEGGEAWRPLVPLRETGDRTPLFCVHGGSGNVASFPHLARALPEDQPVYGLQWDGLDGRGGSRSIEAMAQRYLDEVRQVQPTGPYLLAGQCVGGLIARDMARRLLDEGEDVGLLVMYESPNVTTRHFRFKADWPPFPRPVEPLLRRLTAVALTGRNVVKGDVALGDLIRSRLRDVTRRPVPTEHRTGHGSRVIARAVWRHRPRPVPVPTLYVNTGEREAWKMALTGVWDDGLLGWSDHVSEQFRPVRVSAEHNDVPFAPGAIEAVAAELERFHQART